MNPLRAALCTATALGIAASAAMPKRAAPADGRPGRPPAILAATLHQGRLICVYAPGRVAVWRTSDWGADNADAARTSFDGLRAVASDGHDLWGATDIALI